MRVIILNKTQVKMPRVDGSKPTFSYGKCTYEIIDTMAKLRKRPLIPWPTKTFVYWERYPKPIDVLDPRLVDRLKVPQIVMSKGNPSKPELKYLDGGTLDTILGSSGILRYIGEKPVKLNLKFLMWISIALVGAGFALRFLGLI